MTAPRKTTPKPIMRRSTESCRKNPNHRRNPTREIPASRTKTYRSTGSDSKLPKSKLPLGPVQPPDRLGDPNRRSRDTGRSIPYSGSVIFWAVVSDEIDQVIEFFPSRSQAERMLAMVLLDEPAWRDIFRVEKIEFLTGTAN